MKVYDTLRGALPARPGTWLIMGAAGFVGSHPMQRLLKLGQHIVGLDNFATGASTITKRRGTRATLVSGTGSALTKMMYASCRIATRRVRVWTMFCTRRFWGFASLAGTPGPPAVPNVKTIVGKPLLPCAVTKYVTELYANMFAFVSAYSSNSIGLRHLNIFDIPQNSKGHIQRSSQIGLAA